MEVPLSTLTPLAPDTSEFALLRGFADNQVRAAILLPGFPSQCPGRLVAADERTVTFRAFDPQWVGRLVGGVTLALVTTRDSTRHSCFYANIRRVTDDGCVVFELPNHVSTVEVRQAARQIVPEDLDIAAVLRHGEHDCAVRLRDVSAHGIGLVLDPGQRPPPVKAAVSLVLGDPHELVLPSTVAFVSGSRLGILVDADAGADTLLEFAAFVGRFVQHH